MLETYASLGTSSGNLCSPSVKTKRFHPFKVVEELLQHPKTDVNKPDKNGYSALIWAADLNQPDIVKILLQQPGIEVEEKVEVENGKF